MIIPNPAVKFSGERFRVLYTLTGYTEEAAHQISQFICIEDTLEYPYELIAPGDYHDQMVGQVEEFTPQGDSRYQVWISYAVETTGYELPQLLNVVYGNVTFIPGIRVEKLDLSPSILSAFKGPRYGKEGIRKMVGVKNRPLISTALKPMGISSI